MRKIFIVIFLSGWLAACRSQPVPSPSPFPPSPSPTPTAVSPTPAPAGTAGAYLPVISEAESAPSPLPPTPSATVTPVPTPTPTAVPTPAFPAYNGPPLDRSQLGVQIHIHREDIDEIMDHLRVLDVGWVKVQVSWKLYQPGPERYDEFRFQELDQLVHRANGAGMRVLLSVSKAPEWSRVTAEMDGPPIEYGHYQSFMEVLAARYRGNVAAYELWNEPNLQREWNGVPLSAVDLVALLREGAAGARAGDPEAIIVSAAPATTGINDGVIAIDDRVFLRQMVAAGVGEVVDGIGVHPYGWANPPHSSVAEPDTAVPSHNDHPSFFFRDTLDDYRAILAAAGVERPLWVTEFGWGSFDQFGAAPPPGAEFMNNVTEWQQAQYVLRAFAMGQEREWVGPMILWNLNFGPLLGTPYTMSGYSILRPDGSERPAYLSLADAPKR